MPDEHKVDQGLYNQEVARGDLDAAEMAEYQDKLHMPNQDMVKSPRHYTGALKEKLGIEVIDISNALNLNGNRFSILRYVLRAGLKDPTKEIEDLEKIIEYANFEIRRLKDEPISNTRRQYQLPTKGDIMAERIRGSAL